MGLSKVFSLFTLDIPFVDLPMFSRSFFMGLSLLGNGDVLLIFDLVCISKIEVTTESCALKTGERLQTCEEKKITETSVFSTGNRIMEMEM